MTEKNKNDLTETPIKSIAEENTDFEKKIEQYINKKIRRIIVKTGLAVFLVLIILFFVISPAMDALYLNPYKLQKDQTFFSVMRDYYDVTRPYIEINNIQAEKIKRRKKDLEDMNWEFLPQIMRKNVKSELKMCG